MVIEGLEIWQKWFLAGVVFGTAYILTVFIKDFLEG